MVEDPSAQPVEDEPARFDLTAGPVPGLVRRLAIPASIGFFFNTMFNVVDTWYGGLISTEAVAGLTLSFPIFFLIIACGSGVSTGATTLISNSLGAKEEDEPVTWAAQAISFGIIVSAGLTVVGLLISPALFRFLGATGSYLDTALAYINVIFFGTVLFMLNQVLNGILSSTGDTVSFRNFLLVGFVLNLGLDPWFVYGGAGLPAMGLAGVAWATVLIQLVGVIYLGWRASHTPLVSWRCLGRMRPRFEYYKELARQGFPASLNMMTVALGIFVITWYISDFGQEAVAAYGIATRIEQIALLPTIGLNIATLAIVGQNNGAGLYARVREAWYTAIRYGLVVLTVGGIMLLVAAPQLMGLFTADEEVIAIGATYLRIAAFVGWAYVFLFVTVAALQAVKRPMFAVWIGLFRQIVGPIVAFTVLAHVLGWGLLGIWWGVFIVTWTGAGITWFYGQRTLPQAEPHSPG